MKVFHEFYREEKERVKKEKQAEKNLALQS